MPLIFREARMSATARTLSNFFTVMTLVGHHILDQHIQAYGRPQMTFTLWAHDWLLLEIVMMDTIINDRFKRNQKSFGTSWQFRTKTP